MLCRRFQMHGNMTLWRPLLVAILLFFSFGVYADTYPAKQLYSPGNGQTYTSHSAACAFYNNSANTSSTYYRASDSFPQCKIVRNTDGYIEYISSGVVASCPYGGSLSGSWPKKSCINAASCPSGQNRNTVTGQCQTPPACGPYQTYNQGTNSCQDIVCPLGQTYQATVLSPSGSCVAIPPSCDGFDTPICSDGPVTCIGSSGYMRQLSVVRCTPVPCDAPDVSNAAGDGCIPVQPLACPVGQHPNAANTACDADDIAACPSGTRSGTINGIRQCIPSDIGTGDKQTAQVPQDGSTAPPQSINTGESKTTGTTTTTNSDGTTSVSITDTATELKLDTTGLAQDTTLQSILDTLKGNGHSSTAWTEPGPGTVPVDGNDADIASKKLELQSLVSGIKGQFSTLAPTISGGGAIPCGSPISLSSLGISLTFCMSDYASTFEMIGTGVYAVAAVVAVFIVLGGV